MTKLNEMRQAPIRNQSVIGAQVYSHSGEFAPQVFDLELPARGVSFQFIRKYGSANKEQIDALGRGWTFTYAKRLVPDGSDVLYTTVSGAFTALLSPHLTDAFYRAAIRDARCRSVDRQSETARLSPPGRRSNRTLSAKLKRYLGEISASAKSSRSDHGHASRTDRDDRDRHSD